MFSVWWTSNRSQIPIPSSLRSTPFRFHICLLRQLSSPCLILLLWLAWDPDLYPSCVLVLPLLVFFIFQRDSIPEMCPPTRVGGGCLEGRKEPASTAGFVVRSVGDQKQPLRCLQSSLMKWERAILGWTGNVPSILFEKWNASPGKKKKKV